MYKTVKRIAIQLWYNIWNLRFLFAVGFCVVICMMPSVGSVPGKNTVIKVFFRKDFQSFVAGDAACSAQAILRGFMNSDWFAMLLLAACSFPAVTRFVEEYYSGMFYFELCGLSAKNYSVVKFVAAALSSGIVFLCGFAVYVILVHLRFPELQEYSAAAVQNYEMMYGSMSAYWAELSRAVAHVTLVAVLGGAVVSVVAVFLRDRYFLFGLPMLVVFFLGRLKLYLISNHWELSDAGNGWWNLLIPDTYPSFYWSFQYHTGRAYGWFLLIAGLELAGMFLLFSMRVRKKVRSNG